MDTKQVSLLLVDDDDVEAELVKRSLSKAKIANQVFRARDGEEALKILRGEHETKVKPPYLVLLYLNMPKLNGIEFLDVIRADENLKKTIVFVLTTSDDERDRLAAYERSVAGYVVKSRAGEQFVNLIEMLTHYWRIVEFPS